VTYIWCYGIVVPHGFKPDSLLDAHTVDRGEVSIEFTVDIDAMERSTTDCEKLQG